MLFVYIERVLEMLCQKVTTLSIKIHFSIQSFALEKQGHIECDKKSLQLCQKVYLYKHGGSYKIGKGVRFGYNIGGRFHQGYCELQSRDEEAIISIGNNTAINNNFLVISRNSIAIGEHCRIGINCQIMDFEAHDINPQKRSIPGKIGRVIIGNNVWIGNNVTILKDVVIGENSIIGAGAIVCSDIPDNVVAVGVPARPIKKI